MQTNMLMQNGANEVELLEFTVGTNNYGINISKVSEIMQDCVITPIPNAPEEVEGVFIPRDTLITVIDLHKVLKTERTGGKSTFIVCRFNNMNVAFRVSSVRGFQRILWKDINDAPAVAGNGSSTSIATGVAKIENRIIMILDFEKIMADVSGTADPIGTVQMPPIADRDAKLIIVDDSPFLRRKTENAMRELGFTNITSFANGSDALDYLMTRKSSSDILSEAACVISDIEMPKMDGIELTKRIRSDPVLQRIPVILFSSLIDDRMEEKCRDAGAQAQFSKPDTNELASALINLVNKAKSGAQK